MPDKWGVAKAGGEVARTIILYCVLCEVKPSASAAWTTRATDSGIRSAQLIVNVHGILSPRILCGGFVEQGSDELFGLFVAAFADGDLADCAVGVNQEAGGPSRNAIVGPG